MDHENMKNLIKIREEALEKRQRVQEKIIQKMFDKNRISPKTFQNKKFELEKWVNKEKENI